MPFVLTISERNRSWAGRPPLSILHDTREAALAELLDYVRRNWATEVGTDQPVGGQELIAEYFDDLLETYTISEA